MPGLGHAVARTVEAGTASFVVTWWGVLFGVDEMPPERPSMRGVVDFRTGEGRLEAPSTGLGAPSVLTRAAPWETFDPRWALEALASCVVDPAADPLTFDFDRVRALVEVSPEWSSLTGRARVGDDGRIAAVTMVIAAGTSEIGIDWRFD